MPKPKIPLPARPTTILAPQTFSDGGVLPKLFIFDLDYTLWPFWVDTHCSPPLKASSDHSYMTDRTGEQFAFYNDVPSILATLKHHPECKVGVASRTSAPDLAGIMLRGLEFPFHVAKGTSKKDLAKEDESGNGAAQTETKQAIRAFDQLEIYPGDKKRHMRKLHEGLGVAYEDMLFFDDESRNFNVETLGVTMWLVRDGTTRVEVDKGVKEWRKRRGVGESGDRKTGKGEL